MLEDFVVGGAVRKEEAEAQIRKLYLRLREEGCIAAQPRFQLTAERLPGPVVLGDILLV